MFTQLLRYACIRTAEGMGIQNVNFVGLSDHQSRFLNSIEQGKR